MKRLLLPLTIAMAAMLAACSGGSGGGGGGLVPTPTPAPTATPVSYQTSILFVGGLAGNQIQGELRRPSDAGVSSSSIPAPIMVVAPFFSGLNTSGYGGTAYAVVSPLPSASPPTTFSQTNSNAVLTTPAPAPSGQTPAPLPSGAIASAIITSGSTVQAQVAGTATATIGSPVNAAPSTAVYSYMSIGLACQDQFQWDAGNNNHWGWKWNGTTWVADDSPATDDIYIDGPACLRNNPGEASTFVHVPGGDTRLSTDTAFYGVAASQWANSETSFALLSGTNPDGSSPYFVIGKTRDGQHTFKLYPNNAGPPLYFGGIEVAGAGVDGF